MNFSPIGDAVNPEGRVSLGRLVILIGAPGSGKGTLAARLCAHRSMLHISTGDLFRAHIHGQTELGKLAQLHIDRGELVPDEITIKMLAERLDQQDAFMQDIILDGFPRTVEQARTLSQVLPGELSVAFLNTPVQDLTLRVTGRRSCLYCNRLYNIHFPNLRPKLADRCDFCSRMLFWREDDVEHTLIRRLETYNTSTAPVLAYYKELGCKLVEFEPSIADEPIEDVADALGLKRK